MTEATVIIDAHRALLDDPAALDRLRELRGWTPDAIRQLGLGLDRNRVLIPVLDAQGRPAALLRYQPNPDRRDGQPKTIATPGSTRELFPPPETIDPSATVWIVEGEPDAIAAASIGLPAVAIPGTGGWQTGWAERFADRHIVVCCDCDTPGRGLAARVADDLTTVARSVRILDLAPARDDGHDISDLVVDADADDLDSVRDLLERAADLLPIHLPEKDRPPRPRLTVADWRTALLDHLDGNSDETAWPIPFPVLKDAADGGIRPGEVWVIAGYTSHGKSVYVDMLLDEAAAAGAHCHLYMTEMTVVQRGLRLISRRTGIPFRTLRRRWLDSEQDARARQEIAKLDYAATVVTDWTPQHVAADARATGTQIAVIDLLHGFHYSDERELSAYVDTFSRAATTDAAGASSGAAVVLVCHLNDAQMRDSRSPRRPRPGMHSLKGATAIKQRADAVMFVWLEDDDDGVPTTEGEVWIAKARNGAPASQPVTLDTSRLVFTERGAASQGGMA